MAVLNQITPEQFVNMLTSEFNGISSIEVCIDNSQTWPRFKITGRNPNTASITGFYSSPGNSYLQISLSGREEFTGNKSSSERFLWLIKQIVNVLIEQGCIEKRWTSADGQVKKSTIELSIYKAQASHDIGLYHLGKAPHFWQRSLGLSIKRFAPYSQK